MFRYAFLAAPSAVAGGPKVAGFPDSAMTAAACTAVAPAAAAHIGGARS
ncbi:hypothetical protein AB0M87_29315 [Streptomyces sp. NPDC051320]